MRTTTSTPISDPEPGAPGALRVADPAPAARPRRPRFAVNLAWNLLGQGAPLLVAVVCIPPLIRTLGEVRFGVLALAWTLVGYFSLFDLGLGRALTQAVAARVGSASRSEMGELCWTALAAMAALGGLAGGVLWACSPWVVSALLADTQGPVRDEALRACHVLALTLPSVVLTSGLRGLLEALRRFDLSNAVRAPLGMLTFCAPLLAVTLAGPTLVAAVVSLALARLLAMTVYALMCVKAVPFLGTRPTLRPAALRPLLQRGAWITVSNVVSPLMVSMDRFFVASLAGAAAVAYYATPFEVVSKLLVAPTALVGVLFPSFASTEGEHARAAQAFGRSVRGLLVLLLPVCLVLVAFAPEGLGLWLGPEYAREATPVLRWLSVGVLFNALAYVPAVYLQATRRPDLCTKFHLLELPLYVAAVLWLGRTWGVAGVAMAWAGRVALDAVLLFAAARRELGRAPLAGRHLLSIVVATGLLGVVAAPGSLAVRAALATAGLVLLALAGPHVLADASERAALWSRVRRLVPR